MADLRDFTGKNRKFTGTIGERISTGTTGERDTSFAGGTIRFNTTTSLMEYYTGTEWKSIDAPPTITNFTVDGGSPVTSTFLTPDSSIKTIVINGSLFSSGATVLFTGTGGGDVSPLTTVFTSSSALTVTVNSNSFSGTYEPYDIRVTNLSGLFALLENCIVSDAQPIFITASGTLGTINDSSRSSYTLSTAAATDPDGDTITYSISSGTLPTGLSINSLTAAITGTASAVGTNTTSTFTVSAATSTQTSTRSFSITVNAPVITTFNSDGTFTVPTGLTSVDVLVVAGGGSGTGSHQGGGGAGGLIFRPGFTVTPGTTIPVTVGGGAPAGGNRGSDSVFSNLTAKGGGGNNGNGGAGPNGPGGSGAGSPYDPSGSSSPGTATQPGQPGDSGTYGFGNPGGNGFYTTPPTGAQGGGGGGAGGAGGNSGPNNSGTGGAGREYSISGSAIYYAGGGCGGAHTNAGPGTGGIGGGGTRPGSGPGSVANAGTANRGGGGGGSNDAPPGGAGGSGVVIVKY
jgi:hypothetical protein